jgi:hypothetical protein
MPKNWKTTVQGFLGFLNVTLTTLSGYMGASDLTTTGHLQAPVKIVTAVNVTLGLCRAWIAYFQVDAQPKV